MNPVPAHTQQHITLCGIFIIQMCCNSSCASSISSAEVFIQELFLVRIFHHLAKEDNMMAITQLALFHNKIFYNILQKNVSILKFEAIPS